MLAVRLREHRHSLTEGPLEKSKLAQHTYEGHKVGVDKARIVEIESNNRYTKYKVLTHMAFNKSDDTTQSVYFSHMDSLYQQRSRQFKGKVGKI
jgi:hypothetical protein